MATMHITRYIPLRYALGLLLLLACTWAGAAQPSFPEALTPYVEQQTFYYAQKRQALGAIDALHREMSRPMMHLLMTLQQVSSAGDGVVSAEGYATMHEEATAILLQYEGRGAERAAKEVVTRIMLTTLLASPLAEDLDYGDDLRLYATHALGSASGEVLLLVGALQHLHAQGHEVTELARRVWAEQVAAYRFDLATDARADAMGLPASVARRVSLEGHWRRTLQVPGHPLYAQQRDTLDLDAFAAVLRPLADL